MIPLSTGPSLTLWLVLALLTLPGRAQASPRQAEALDRGLVAIRLGDGDGAYVGWRLLATDAASTAFHVYRATADEPPVRLTAEPLTSSTNFVDRDADASRPATYSVRAVVDGRELEPSKPAALPAGAEARPYLAVPLTTPAGYTANDAAVGDLDGDGQYDLVIKEELRPRDNSHRGVSPGSTKLAAYRLDGTFLWRIDLGKNIREGAHYTPFIVYDLDGDGRAEVAVRTAEGTTDGAGVTIGDTDGDGRTDYVNPRTGYILEGPEFISIFDGRTGKEIARDRYIPRGRVADWGDDYGNRVDRFLMGVAYVDGVRPSLVLCRGYYALTKLEAWNWRGGKLSQAWAFSSGDRAHRGYGGQGNHSLSVGDVDGDGRDEIVYGAMCVDDDGKGLYTTKLGHGDALHLSDLDPDRPGLEVFAVHEDAPSPAGVEFRDARTGKLIWGLPSTDDVGRGVAFDIDPRHRGAESWAFGGGIRGLYTCRGERIADAAPRSCNMAVWWDADPLRELLSGTTIDKWNWEAGRLDRLLSAHDLGCASNNGSKANPCFAGDILGDWREEVVWRNRDSTELRIFTSTIPTDRRMVTLMHDPVYRLSAAHQNNGYNQPTQPGFYLGDGMANPPVPQVVMPGQP